MERKKARGRPRKPFLFAPSQPKHVPSEFEQAVRFFILAEQARDSARHWEAELRRVLTKMANAQTSVQPRGKGLCLVTNE